MIHIKKKEKKIEKWKCRSTWTTPAKDCRQPWESESGTIATDITTRSALQSAKAKANIATTLTLSEVINSRALGSRNSRSSPNEPPLLEIDLESSEEALTRINSLLLILQENSVTEEDITGHLNPLHTTKYLEESILGRSCFIEFLGLRKLVTGVEVRSGRWRAVREFIFRSMNLFVAVYLSQQKEIFRRRGKKNRTLKQGEIWWRSL